MTTSHSPLRVLKAQADKIAQKIKAAERGDLSADDPYGKIAAALDKPSVKFGVVMDDKVITIEMPWETIRKSGEVALSEMILRRMRGARETVQ